MAPHPVGCLLQRKRAPANAEALFLNRNLLVLWAEIETQED
jgi:hypothetical protein